MKQRVMIVLAALSLAMVGSTAWSAEVRLDFYGGIAKSESNDITASLPLTNESHSQTVNFEDGMSAGMRLRIFSEAAPIIGYGQDFYYFSAQSQGVDMGVYATSPMLMLRIPMAKSEQFPLGMINPYAGIGPTFAILGGTFDLQPGLSQRISDTTFEIGYQFVAGLLINLEHNLGIFGEYKFTHMTPNFEDEECAFVFNCVTSERSKVGLQSHHFLIGLSVRF